MLSVALVRHRQKCEDQRATEIDQILFLPQNDGLIIDLKQALNGLQISFGVLRNSYV